jgi:dual-specificity kinase
MMERVLGPIPEHMIRNASSSAQKYFRRVSRLNWPEGAVSRESIRAVRKLDRLKVPVSLKFAVLAMLIYQLIITFYLETLIRSCHWSGYLFS